MILRTTHHAILLLFAAAAIDIAHMSDIDRSEARRAARHMVLRVRISWARLSQWELNFSQWEGWTALDQNCIQAISVRFVLMS